jgi:nucleoid-associated protein YgaU
MYVYARRRPRSPWPGRLRNAALVATALVALSLGLARSAAGEAPGPTETVVVQPGDTLWSIAAARYPGQDVRREVWRIEHVNHLSSGSQVLQPGEQLQVPSR